MKKSPTSLIATLGALLAFGAPNLYAVDYTWTGNGANNNWNTGANWLGGVAPSGVYYTLHFDGTTKLAPTNSLGNQYVTSLIFEPTAGSFVLSGSSVTLLTSIVNKSANLQTIASGLNNTAAALAIQTFGDLTITGTIGQSAAGKGIVKSGPGTLTLGGATSYTGITEIDSGSLVLDMSSGGTLATNEIRFGVNTVYALSNGGSFTLKGLAAGTSAQTVAKMGLYSYAAHKIVVDANGGGGTTLTTGSFSRYGSSTLNINLASPGAAMVITNPPANVSGTTTTPLFVNGIISFMTVTDETKTGFATFSSGSSGNLVRAVPTVQLAPNSSDVNANYWTSGNISLPYSQIINSLTITGSGTAGGVGYIQTKAILMEEGVGNYYFASPQVGSFTELIIHQYSTSGTLSIGGRILQDKSSAPFSKTGPGVVVLTQDSVSTGTGNTYIQQGTLVVNGQIASLTEVMAGAVLGGTGTIGGNVYVRGGSAPGTAGSISLVDGMIGTLTLGKGLTLAGGTAAGTSGYNTFLNFEVGAAGADSIAVGGTLTLAGDNALISLTRLAGAAKGDYNLLTYASLASGSAALTFAGGHTTYASGGYKYTLSTTSTAEKLNVSEFHDRVVTASNANFGNVFVGRAVSGTSNLTTTGDTNAGSNVYYTSVNVDGQAFNGSGSTGTHVFNQTFATSGSKSGSSALTVTGEGIVGESPVAVNAGYSANVFQEASLSTNSPTISGGSNTADLTLTNAASTDGGQRAGVTVTSLTANNSNFTTTLAGDASVGTATTSNVTATVGTVSVAGDRLNGTYTGTVTGAAQYTDSALRSQASVGNVNWSVLVSGTIGGQTSTGSADVKQAFIASGSSYAGYGLTSGITGGKGSVATLLGGTASGDATVKMSYITATEFTGAGKVDSAQRIADILTISGVAPKSGTGFDGSSLTDKFVLQISFTGTEGYVAWYDTELGRFVNAIAGNSTVEGGQGILDAGLGFGNYFANTAYNDALNVLGNYGYDAATHTAWAVVDHNSDFTVLTAVPEPSTWAMIMGGIGMLAVGQRLRRKLS